MPSRFLDRPVHKARTSLSHDQPVPQLLETTTIVLKEQFAADFVWTCLRLPGESSVPLSSAGQSPAEYPSSPIVWEGDGPRLHADLTEAVVAHRTLGFQEATFDVVLGRPGRPFSPAEGTRFEALCRRAQRALDRASILQCEQALRYQESLLRRREAACRRLEAEVASRERILRELAHDLINDLTPLTYAAEELAEPRSATDAMRLLLLIDRQCVRMRQRLRDGLKVSQVIMVTQDWRPCLADLAEIWNDAFMRAGQSFCLLVPDRPVPVRAAEQHLMAIAANLLSNAHKFTPPGGHIEMRLQHAGTHAVLEVTDTGRGMQPEFQARLFEPGAREHADVEGSGMGLSQIQQQIVAMGGQFQIRSEPGIGTICLVLLPLA